MNNNEIIYNFLKTKGFVLSEKKISEHFGDYQIIFSNLQFQIRFSSSRSIESLDIRSIRNDNWFDLALVKALIYDVKKLNIITTIDEYKDFLQKDFLIIEKLFADENYLTTNNKLDALNNERASQMFPSIKRS